MKDNVPSREGDRAEEALEQIRSERGHFHELRDDLSNEDAAIVIAGITIEKVVRSIQTHGTELTQPDDLMAKITDKEGTRYVPITESPLNRFYK